MLKGNALATQPDNKLRQTNKTLTKNNKNDMQYNRNV